MNRVADIHLRGRAGALRACAYWPDVPGAALLVFFNGVDSLCRDICSQAHLVVLSVHPLDVHDAVTAMEWAASHAAELGADPDRLLVAGPYAAAVASHARDEQWPDVAECHPDDLLRTLRERTET